MVLSQKRCRSFCGEISGEMGGSFNLIHGDIGILNSQNYTINRIINISMILFNRIQYNSLLLFFKIFPWFFIGILNSSTKNHGYWDIEIVQYSYLGWIYIPHIPQFNETISHDSVLGILNSYLHICLVDLGCILDDLRNFAGEVPEKDPGSRPMLR